MRKLPSARCPCKVASRLVPAAYTVIALVLAAEIRSLRYTLALTSPMADAAMTGPMRPTMTGADAGSVTVCPPNDWPGVTVSRLVPSASISATSCARLEPEIPSTATIVAMPSEMPTADRMARAGLLPRPRTASGQASSARIRLRGGIGPSGRGSC